MIKYMVLLVILANLLHRIRKFIKFVWFGKHEVERICESRSEKYQKCIEIDKWLARTNCESIRVFLNNNFNQEIKNKDSLAPRTVSRILYEYCRKDIQTFTKPGKKKINIPNSNLNHRYQLKNLEDADIVLKSTVKELTKELYNVIERAKSMHRSSASCKEHLLNSLYRIICYKMTLMLAEQLAATRYDSNLELHREKLINLWNNLIKDDLKYHGRISRDESLSVFPPELCVEINNKSDIVSNRWSHIGFQGQDPGTDFRGMGVLGLAQLEYLSRKPKTLARDLLKRSLNEECSYPFAIVGINVTYNLITLFRDGSMKHLYYDSSGNSFKDNQQALNLLTILNDLYVELFLDFDSFWHNSKPKTIFEFKDLMDKFISRIRSDLYSRNYVIKSIH